MREKREDIGEGENDMKSEVATGMKKAKAETHCEDELRLNELVHVVEPRH